MAPKPTLLIVDDEPNVVRTLQLIFEAAGYRVHTAMTAAEAIEYLRGKHKVDGVIADLNLEREDIGLEVARAACALKPRPVVLICTGYATLKNTKKALEMRVDHLATKPVDPEELTSTVALLLQRREQQKRAARGSR